MAATTPEDAAAAAAARAMMAGQLADLGFASTAHLRGGNRRQASSNPKKKEEDDALVALAPGEMTTNKHWFSVGEGDGTSPNQDRARDLNRDHNANRQNGHGNVGRSPNSQRPSGPKSQMPCLHGHAAPGLPPAGRSFAHPMLGNWDARTPHQRKKAEQLARKNPHDRQGQHQGPQGRLPPFQDRHPAARQMHKQNVRNDNKLTVPYDNRPRGRVGQHPDLGLFPTTNVRTPSSGPGSGRLTPPRFSPIANGSFNAQRNGRQNSSPAKSSQTKHFGTEFENLPPVKKDPMVDLGYGGLGGGSKWGPAGAKPNGVKPTEIKATEVKPAEIKPAEVKPVEVKPAEVKSGEVQQPSDDVAGTPSRLSPAQIEAAAKIIREADLASDLEGNDGIRWTYVLDGADGDVTYLVPEDKTIRK